MHSQTRPRPYSTKLFRPPAEEFEQIFVQHGWAKVNRMFGKRCSVRWYAMLGAERLKAARARFVRGEAS